MFDEAKCTLCGDCFVRCQYVNYTREKAIEEITTLVEGKGADILKQCITCAACNEYCPEGANPFDLICRLQEETGALPVPQALTSGIAQIGRMPGEVIKGDLDKPILSLCITEPVIPKGAIEGQMFQGLTVVKGGEYFCYAGALHMGKESLIRQNAQRFVDKMASFGAREIVLLHDDCHAMLARMVPDCGIKVPFKPVHIAEYLLNYLRDHQNSITKVGKRIAYQRPCISRFTAEKETMLDELFELVGAERVERNYDREDALCCGSGFGGYYPEKVPNVQDRNLTDAKDHGAEAMIFLCPWCYSSLKKGCQEHGMVPIFITELCQVALGEKLLSL